METVNPERSQIVRVTVACGVLATLAVFLRFLARWRSKASFAADDWWMLASLIPSYSMLAVGSIMVTSGGGGRHTNTLTQSQIATFLKTLDAAVITYTLTIFMVKISILLLYRRIFTTPLFKRATLIVGTACVAWLIAALLCLAFQCRTNAERYNLDTLFSNHCIDLKGYWIAVTGSNLVLDLVVLCMPLYIVSNLKIPTRQKLWLSGIFALGILVCIAALMRIITINWVKGADLTYTAITCYMWSQVEPTMATVCACLTTLRPLFVGFNISFLSSFTWSGRPSPYSSSAKNKERRQSDLRYHGESDKIKDEKQMQWPSARGESDVELYDFDQMLRGEMGGAMSVAEKAESSKTKSSWQDEGGCATARANMEEYFV
ncbi:hypothetical protein BDR22DRAFT_939785 [Usnea florida]